MPGEAGGGGDLISVIVPVYDHWNLVPALLSCLARQSLPASRFELVLVDNGSQVVPAPPPAPFPLTVLHCEAPGSYAARNLGAAQARGAWLAFTDADCLPRPQWLAALAAACRPDLLLAGPVEVRSAAGRPNAWEIFDAVKGIPQERYVSRGYAATANLMVPAAVFAALGGFDAGRFSGGDAEFCRRAGARGFPLRFVPGAAVDHPARASWTEIVEKARRVKGGQIAAGGAARRAAWFVRTLVPPVRAVWRFLRDRRHPLRHRLVAVAVLFRVWVAEVGEAIYLVAGGKPSRR